MRPGPDGRFALRPALGKEAANFIATDHGRALAVDWLQALA